MSDIIFGSSEPREAYKIKKLLKEKKIRKIAPRLYTTDFESEPAEIIRQNFFSILNSLYPGAVLSHRSAFEIKPTQTNQVFVTYTYTKKIRLPGITINFLEGKSSFEDDIKIGPLCASSLQRALLENMQISKRKGPESKTLPKSYIEDKLKKIQESLGREEVLAILFKAEHLAVELNMQREFALLKKLADKVILSEPGSAPL